MKNLLYLLMVLPLFFCACSDDDDFGTFKINEPSGGFSVDRYKALVIKPVTNGSTGASFRWSIGDSVIWEEQDLYFVGPEERSYPVTLTVENSGNVQSQTVTINVKKESRPYSRFLTKVIDFMPAPGQFTNKLPLYEDGDNVESMIRKAEERIVGETMGMISLGGFGGYVVVGFDHTIANLPDKRHFKVYGNAFYADANPRPDAPLGGSCEPGVIMVGIDKNQNGVPDDDEWYEIAGSEYNKPTTVKNYEITYYRPDENKERTPDLEYPYLNDTTYIRWTDNQKAKGYIYRNTFHDQSYYPQWIDKNELTFKGTRPTNNAVDESGIGQYYVLYAFDWGYADNHPNKSDLSDIDINWAVDSKGRRVKLPGIDFIKIYTGLNQYCGWLGETSTEIMAVEDLNIK